MGLFVKSHVIKRKIQIYDMYERIGALYIRYMKQIYGIIS